MAKLIRALIVLTSVIAVLALNPSKAAAQILERLEVGGNYSFVRANAPAIHGLRQPALDLAGIRRADHRRDLRLQRAHQQNRQSPPPLLAFTIVP